MEIDNIQWQSDYNSPSMDPYPLKPIVCVKANMGTGKTVQLVNHMKRHVTKESKCLVITYQRLLAAKYHKMFKKFGFINYLDHGDREISSEKVIVCLDSLWRVVNKEFDFVFIDEAVSVLLHFNSNLMNKKDEVYESFHQIIIQAKYVYFLDAAATKPIVRNIVSYLESQKKEKAFWTCNRYVRETNRKAFIVVNKARTDIKLFRKRAMEKVVNLLTEGKRVVVSSSTKVFTTLLGEYIAKHIGDDFRQSYVIVHNSGTRKNTPVEDPSLTWWKYRCVIYSPAVSAGVSFEADHFDTLVACIENSFYTPPIDIVLQQLFRVRKLTDGRMSLFVNDPPMNEKFPCKEPSVEAWLDAHHRRFHKFYPLGCMAFDSVDDNKHKYDRANMSYGILKGIVMNMNSSIMNFTDILIDTLRNEYNIPTYVRRLHE